MKNSKKEVTDENGLISNYEYKIKWGRSKNLGKTDKISNLGTYRNSLFLNLSVSEIEVVLSLNGKHKKDVKLISHLYELYELNPFGSDRIPTEYKKEELIYTPELDNISIQKEIVKKVITSKFYQSGFVKNENDKKVSNDWINASSELIKSSNILNIKTLEDFNKIAVDKKVEEYKNSDIKKDEVTIVEVTENKILNINVDNLRVRTSPNLDAEKIENLPLNTKVEFLNEKSTDRTKVTIKGQEINEYWYKIKTSSGKIMRRILRKIASKDTSNLGDTSTLLNPECVQEIMKNSL